METGWGTPSNDNFFQNFYTFLAVFPLSRFFSVNQQLVGTMPNSFWKYGKNSFRKFEKFVKIGLLVYFNTGLTHNLGHM